MNAHDSTHRQHEPPEILGAPGDGTGAGRGIAVAGPGPDAVPGNGRCRLVVPPGPVVQEIAHLVTSVLPHRISIQAEVPEELWPIAGDPGEIHRALINVLLNACAAMRERGHLALSARNATVHQVPPSPIFDAQPGDYVEVAVSHTGFDIYRSPMDPAIGLRLARMARVLCDHGGFGRVKSRTGRLTTVFLYFPRAGFATVPIDSAAAPAPHAAGGILIVDDEDAILAFGRQHLARAGYHVLVARDGLEALAIFQRRRSDIGLVLTDLAMPGMNGFTLLWALRRSKPDLRVMVATGHGTEDNFRELRAMGVRQVLLKPFTSEHLLDAVSRALAEPVQCELQLFSSSR